jgi:acyl-CoA dehydrogenase
MYQAMPASPMFDAEHEAFRATVRRYVEKELLPHVDAWDEAEAFPRAVYRSAAEEVLNDLAARQLGWV